MANCSVCSATLVYNVCPSCTSKAQQELEHGCDGPVTDFVLIARACRLAAKGTFGPGEIANALDQALREFGYLNSDNPVYQTGS